MAVVNSPRSRAIEKLKGEDLASPVVGSELARLAEVVQKLSDILTRLPTSLSGVGAFQASIKEQQVDLLTILKSTSAPVLLSQLTVPTFTANVATFDLGPVRASGARILRGYLFMDQPTVANGFRFKQLLDGVNYDPPDDAFTVSANSRVDFAIRVFGEFVRITVEHAGVAPTVFRMKVFGEPQ